MKVPHTAELCSVIWFPRDHLIICGGWLCLRQIVAFIFNVGLELTNFYAPTLACAYSQRKELALVDLEDSYHMEFGSVNLR